MLTVERLTARALPYTLAFGLLAGACGDNSKPLPTIIPGNEVDAGGTAGETDAAPDPCPARPLAGPELVGLWHLNTSFAGAYSVPLPIVIEETESGDYIVYSVGDPSLSTIFEDGMLVANWQTDFGNGLIATAVLQLTQIDCNGILSGSGENCLSDNCIPVTMSGAKVEALDEPVSEGLTLITEYGGPETGAWREGGITYNVRARGDLAYLARTNGLNIVDISDPAAPEERGFLAAPAFMEGEYYNDIKLLDGPDSTLYAVMASNLRGAVVIDVTDPDNPLEVTTFPINDDPDVLPSVHTLFIEGTRAYLAYNTTESVLVFDLSDPANPQELGGYTNPGLDGSFTASIHDLYVKDGRAYLNYLRLGMTIVDLQNPAEPVLVGEYVDYGGATSHSNWVTEVGERTISIHGDEEYGAHARIVDVDPASPTFLDTLSEYETRPEVSIHNILAHENLAFLTYYQDGLRVLDVSDPANPVKIAHYHTWPGLAPGYGRSFFEGAIGVDYNPETRTIYVADTHRGLLVLRLAVNAQ